MNNASLTTNAYEVIQEFKEFTLKEMNKATRTALRKGAQVLQKTTKKFLKQQLKKATHRNPKYNDRLIDAVRYAVDKKGNLAKVHIMGTDKKGSGTFRLRFFEKGTKVRKHKNGKNIGQIKPLRFFERARLVSQNEINNALTTHLNATIKKINEKRQ